MTIDQMFKLEAVIREDKGGVNRRLGLVCLTKSVRELMEAAQDRKTAEAFTASRVCVLDYLSKLRGLVEILVSAEVRLACAVCANEKAEDIFAATDVEHEESTH